MGTNGGLHPDVLFFQNGFYDGSANYKYYAAHTPLPECEEYVNVCVSNDGTTWSTPNSVTNPVIAQNTATSGAQCEFDADPDMLWIDKYQKGFMITGPEVRISTRENALELFYSTDLRTWTPYDGTQINGNTLPVILSGSNESCGQHTADSGRAAWEATGNCGSTQYPTCIFDKDNNLGLGNDYFWCWYGETVGGNNVGEVGCFTFTWNNLTNDIENFERCNVSTHGKNNPVLSPALDASYLAGMGHIDVVWDQSKSRLDMMALRDDVGAGLNFDIVRYTSTDGLNWTSQGLYMDAGSSETHSCPGNAMYRSSFLHDGEGNKVFPEQVLYSMSCSSGGHDYGIKGGTSFDGDTFDGINSYKGGTLIGMN